MNTRKTIGVDLDGVIANFADVFRHLNNRLHGTLIQDQPSDWDFTNWGLTKEQLSQSWQEVSRIENFWMTLFPYDEPLLLQNLHRLDNQAKLYFITTRAATKGLPIEKQTIKWLRSFGVDSPTVIVTKKKGPIAAALELDAFIDDYYDNLVSVHNADPRIKLYYRVRPYSVETSIPLVKVNSFAEFVNQVI